MTLVEFFHHSPKAALALSGGVDSAYLLYEAIQNGADVRPYFIKTPFQPAFELEDAQRLANFLKVPLTVLHYDILQETSVSENSPERCYYCKRALFRRLYEQAKQDGFSLLLDGTNASDDADDRPGMRALQELNVRSPLRECGLTKKEIRQQARKAGLFLWDKPAYACLATRVPAGTKLTTETLRRIEQAEETLFRMGFTDFRVRIFHHAARIQLPSVQMKQILELRSCVLEALSPYFDMILLDLNGRD